MIFFHIIPFVPSVMKPLFSISQCVCVCVCTCAMNHWIYLVLPVGVTGGYSEKGGASWGPPLPMMECLKIQCSANFNLQIFKKIFLSSVLSRRHSWTWLKYGVSVWLMYGVIVWSLWLKKLSFPFEQKFQSLNIIYNNSMHITGYI